MISIRSPQSGAVFTILGTATWPSIPFETDGTGAHTWTWQISWKAFSKSGTAQTSNNRWDAGSAIGGMGGQLKVTAKSAQGQDARTVTLKGANPLATDVTAYLASRPGSDGFDKILKQETGFRHFAVSGEPVVSFDGGYGMCQLTNPPPTYEQAWNWKRNIDAGLALFAQKRGAAIAYLAQGGRSYTAAQVQYETVSRWNGGAYHVWDGQAAAWVRNPNVVCDPSTGNIGWDMTDPANSGKSEADLHIRDHGQFGAPPHGGAHWRYFGVCYADHVLG